MKKYMFLLSLALCSAFNANAWFGEGLKSVVANKAITGAQQRISKEEIEALLGSIDRTDRFLDFGAGAWSLFCAGVIGLVAYKFFLDIVERKRRFVRTYDAVAKQRAALANPQENKSDFMWGLGLSSLALCSGALGSILLAQTFRG